MPTGANNSGIEFDWNLWKVIASKNGNESQVRGYLRSTAVFLQRKGEQEEQRIQRSDQCIFEHLDLDMFISYLYH